MSQIFKIFNSACPIITGPTTIIDPLKEKNVLWSLSFLILNFMKLALQEPHMDTLPH
jgi:hypothetical protein